MLMVACVVGVAVIECNLRRVQADLLKIYRSFYRNGEDAEEWIVQIDLDEVLTLVNQIRQQQAEESLRRIRSLHCILPVIFEFKRLLFLLPNKLQLQRDLR